MMSIIRTAIGIITSFVVIGIVMRILYFLGSRCFIVRGITNAILKLFQKSDN